MTRAGRLLVERDHTVSVALNRWTERECVCRLFEAVSRVGDGKIWHLMIVALALLGGAHGRRIATALAISALLGVAIYTVVKRSFRRPRPFRSHGEIRLAAMPLDEWSFPSGHTLHATAFTLILVSEIAWLGWLFLPFALLTALSRIVLGLHYPTDVVAGALVGVVVSRGAIELASLLWMA